MGGSLWWCTVFVDPKGSFLDLYTVNTMVASLKAIVVCVGEKVQALVMLLCGRISKQICCQEYAALKMHRETDTTTYTQYLAPAMSSLKYKTFHLYLATMILRRSYLASQRLRSPVKYGWNFKMVC